MGIEETPKSPLGAGSEEIRKERDLNGAMKIEFREGQSWNYIFSLREREREQSCGWSPQLERLIFHFSPPFFLTSTSLVQLGHFRESEREEIEG